MGAMELVAFLRHHPHGVRGGLRQLAASARGVCVTAKNAASSAVRGAVRSAVAHRWVAR